MKYLMLLLIVVMALLTACDDRDTDKPNMTVEVSAPEVDIQASTYVLYNEGNDQNYADITIILEGDAASIDSMRINVEYDNSLGTFNPDGPYAGNAYFIRTTSQGIAGGTFSVKDSACGDVPVVFTIDVYRSVTQTIHFDVMDIPEIGLTAAQDYIPADGETMTDIDIRLTSETDNIGYQWIDIRSNLVVSADSTQTDSLGHATFQVQAPDAANVYWVTAELRKHGKIETIYLNYIE